MARSVRLPEEDLASSPERDLPLAALLAPVPGFNGLDQQVVPPLAGQGEAFGDDLAEVFAWMYAEDPPVELTPQQRYEAAILEGAGRMAHPNEDQRPRFGGLTDIEEETDGCRFNRDLWDRVRVDPESDSEDSEDSEDEEESFYKLVLREGVLPSAAVDDLFNHLPDWSFDCAEALQFLQWHGMKAALGDEAFNAHMGEHVELTPHTSTGIQDGPMHVRRDDEGYYERDETFVRVQPGDEEGERVGTTAPELLAQLPVGGRAMWRNFDDGVEDNAAFKNENAIKVGAGQYFAHPMGMVDEAALTTGLAEHGNDDLTPETLPGYLAEHIRLTETEQPILPW